MFCRTYDTYIMQFYDYFDATIDSIWQLVSANWKFYTNLILFYSLQVKITIIFALTNNLFLPLNP